MTDLEISACIWAEGFEPLPYKDSKGIWTCGIGYNLEAHGIPADWVRPILSRTGITRAQAVQRLEYLWDVAENQVTWNVFRKEWPTFSDAQRFVITDMVFNMGLGNAQRGFLSFKTTIELMKQGEWKQVCSNLRKSKWARDTGRRAERDIQILESDKVRIAL